MIRRSRQQENALQNLGSLGNDDDRYILTSKFPPEQERILDVVIEKLMLDGYSDHHLRQLQSVYWVVFMRTFLLQTMLNL